jgi:putative multiple sugar transport system substrate-binding protein
VKKVLLTLLAIALFFSLTACQAGLGPDKMLIGVSMPTQSLQRWNQDGANMVDQLKAAGYESILQYANNDANRQLQQIKNMISQGCKILVIAAIDGSSLTEVLDEAVKNGIRIIAYDRLIMETPNVDYYATFDNFEVGVIQGKFIETQLKLKTASGPFNIEIFAGDPGDNNAQYFYSGAMSILDPYISDGKLVIKSKQKDFNKVSIAAWASATAQARMDNLLAAAYGSDTILDAILSPNDSVAIGIMASLTDNEYGSTSKPFPILTGQDCDLANIKAILAGQQSMSIFKDTRLLAAKTVEMITAIENDQIPYTNDTMNYNNGVKIVPTALLAPVFANKDNYQEILITSGYYTADQLK